MKHMTKSLLVLGLISLSATIQADLPKAFDYNKASNNYVDETSSTGGNIASNIYFGGTMGSSEAGGYCSGATNCEDNDTAWKLFAGYKYNDRLSAEGAYVNLGDVHKAGDNSDMSAVTASAVGTLPVNDKFDIFGKVGVMRWSSDNTTGGESGFGINYGIGAKMHLNETTKLRAEWEKFPGIDTSTTEDTDVNMISVGVELSTY